MNPDDGLTGNTPSYRDNHHLSRLNEGKLKRHKEKTKEQGKRKSSAVAKEVDVDELTAKQKTNEKTSETNTMEQVKAREKLISSLTTLEEHGAGSLPSARDLRIQDKKQGSSYSKAREEDVPCSLCSLVETEMMPSTNSNSVTGGQKDRLKEVDVDKLAKIQREEKDTMEQVKAREKFISSLTILEDHGAVSLPSARSLCMQENKPPPTAATAPLVTTSSSSPRKPRADTSQGKVRPGAYCQSPGMKQSRNVSARFSLLGKEIAHKPPLAEEMEQELPDKRNEFAAQNEPGLSESSRAHRENRKMTVRTTSQGSRGAEALNSMPRQSANRPIGARPVDGGGTSQPLERSNGNAGNAAETSEMYSNSRPTLGETQQALPRNSLDGNTIEDAAAVPPANVARPPVRNARAERFARKRGQINERSRSPGPLGNASAPGTARPRLPPNATPEPSSPGGALPGDNLVPTATTLTSSARLPAPINTNPAGAPNSSSAIPPPGRRLMKGGASSPDDLTPGAYQERARAIGDLPRWGHAASPALSSIPGTARGRLPPNVMPGDNFTSRSRQLAPINANTSEASTHSRVDTSRLDHGQDLEAVGEQGESNNQEVLIEANLVEDKSQSMRNMTSNPTSDRHILYEAEAVTGRKITVDFFKSAQGKALVACVFLCMLGLILGLVFGLRNSSGSTETFSPSEAPSLSPTMAPTVEFSIHLLPNYTKKAILENPRSAQARALDWASNDTRLEGMSDAQRLERFALASLYYATSGDLWAESHNFLSYDHHQCYWFPDGEETCHGKDFVFHFHLNSNLLRGSIPPEFFGLTEGGMDTIEMRGNDLEGSIPTTVGLLSNAVHLDLSSNSLSGHIPPEMGGLSSLGELLLSENDLTGNLPSRVGLLSNLKGMDLGGNIISGSIPSEFGQLKQLGVLDLSANVLTGPLPTEVGRLRDLALLKVDQNVLSSKIPSEIGRLTKLGILELSECRLSGSLPTEIGTLTNLRFLGLASTDLSGSLPQELFQLSQLDELLMGQSRFTGIIPSYIGRLSLLRRLEMNKNGFNSSVPTEIGLLGSLRILLLGHQSLSGTLPSEMFASHDLRSLDLTSTGIEGNLPTELGVTSKLETLEISHSAIEGPLPTQLGKLSNLVVLDASGCGLSGQLPSEIGKSRRLAMLLLNGNSISGNLPSEIAALKSLTRFEIAENSLEGNLPSEIGGLRQLSHLDLGENVFSGMLPSEIARLGRLESLILEATNVSIPPFMYFPTNLRELSLSKVDINGTFPEDLARLSYLESAVLSFASLSGTIPPSLGKLTNLKRLDLWDNDLRGAIPSEIALLESLAYLDLEENSLEGHIPDGIFLLPNLVEVHLGGNKNLSGTVPDAICDRAIHHPRVDCEHIVCSCCDCSSHSHERG